MVSKGRITGRNLKDGISELTAGLYEDSAGRVRLDSSTILLSVSDSSKNSVYSAVKTNLQSRLKKPWHLEDVDGPAYLWRYGKSRYVLSVTRDKYESSLLLAPKGTSVIVTIGEESGDSEDQ